MIEERRVESARALHKRLLRHIYSVLRAIMERIKSSYTKEDVARLVIDVLLYKEMMTS